MKVLQALRLLQLGRWHRADGFVENVGHVEQILQQSPRKKSEYEIVVTTLQNPWIPNIFASATCLFILFRKFSKSARLLLYLSRRSEFFSSISASFSCKTFSFSDTSFTSSSIVSFFAPSAFVSFVEKKNLLFGSKQM